MALVSVPSVPWSVHCIPAVGWQADRTVVCGCDGRGADAVRTLPAGAARAWRSDAG